MDHGKLPIDNLPPPLAADRLRVFGSAVGRFPREITDVEYARWYRSIESSRERHLWREVLVVLDGAGPFGWKNRILMLEAGDVLLIDTLERHAFSYPPVTRGIRHMWILVPVYGTEVRVSVIRDDGTRLASGPKARIPIAEPPLERWLEKWDLCTRSSGAAAAIEREMLVAYSVATALESVARCWTTDVPKRAEVEVAVDNVREFIDAHPHSDLTLEEIAAATGYSKFHLHREFREATGKTIHEYMTRRRAAHAWGLLSHGYSCTAVAEELGFSSLSSFSRWFRMRTGTTASRVGTTTAPVAHAHWFDDEQQ